MFEDIIAELDVAGITYTEDYETGILTVDIADVDKATLIDVINSVNASGLPFTIDASSLVVTGSPSTDEFLEEEEEAEDFDMDEDDLAGLF